MSIIKKHSTLDSELKTLNENEENNVSTEGIHRNETYEDIVIGLFSFKGRTGRLEFAKIDLTVILLGLVNAFFIIPSATNEYVVGFIITYGLILLALWPMTVRRLHDSNLNGEYYLISLIPSLLNYIGEFTVYEVSFLLTFISAFFGIYFLYLTLRQGDSCANKYGVPNPPKKYRNKTINAICIFLFVMSIVSGMLSAFHYPY